jgi:hypothetical protein
MKLSAGCGMQLSVQTHNTSLQVILLVTYNSSVWKGTTVAAILHSIVLCLIFGVQDIKTLHLKLVYC